MSLSVLVVLISVLLLQLPLAAEMPATAASQMTTEDHLAQPGWWPRKGDAPRSAYVGAAACAECHSEFSKGQREHAMARSSLPVKNAKVPASTLSIGPAQYSIRSENNTLVYTVHYQAQSFSTPLTWVFGSGHHGQTFLYYRAGKWWETHISIFNTFGAGITPGESVAIPESLAGALGRPIPNEELPLCFGCHATAAITSGKFTPATAMPGISCEGCHGPGGAHVALAHSGMNPNPGLIFNPAHLNPAASVDFCGSCHHTWWDVSQMPDQGVTVVRFSAYRLEQSRCWGNGDARLTCAGCHDPHKPLVTDAAAYDQKCLACHVQSAAMKPTADHPGAACPVKTSNCVSCHMARYEVPQMHALFTDHRIRVVRNPGVVPTNWN
jgi:Cytochrome c554 and c-prime